MAIITLADMRNLILPGAAMVFGDYLTYPDQWKEIFAQHISDKSSEVEIETRALPLAQLKQDGLIWDPSHSNV